MTANGPDDRADTGRRLYGRGAGRPLSARRQRLVAELLPRIAVPDGPLNPSALFPDAVEIRLEIGFGGGEHLAAQTARRPDVGFLGAEPFLEGVGKALAAVEEGGLANIRLHYGDGRDLLDRLTGSSIAMAYVLFPDPWPKRRHWRRRFIQPDTVAALARVLTPGGRLRVATDVKSYVAWTLEQVRASPNFAWTARRAADWRTAPGDHAQTRYEAKNIGDCPPTFLDFERL